MDDLLDQQHPAMRSPENPGMDTATYHATLLKKAEPEIKGGKVNYYLVQVTHPQREEVEPYQAECEDVGKALGLTPDEMNIFKEIWRTAAARKHNGKPGHTALYGAQKIYHYAGRILKDQMIAAGTWTKGFLKTL